MARCRSLAVRGRLVRPEVADPVRAVLSWIRALASVVTGLSASKLLDTYEAERRPIAWLRHNQIFARRDYAAMATDDEKKVAIIDDVAMELGQLYRSASVLGAGDELPPALRPEQWAGQPGTRAPHLWVSKDSGQFSTLDLLQRDWVLLTEDDRWKTAAIKVSELLRFPLQILCIGSDLTAPVAAKLTTGTPIEQIVAEPAGKAAIDAHIPTLSAHDEVPDVQVPEPPAASTDVTGSDHQREFGKNRS
jgi:putative polyketide hydroxylase